MCKSAREGGSVFGECVGVIRPARNRGSWHAGIRMHT